MPTEIPTFKPTILPTIFPSSQPSSQPSTEPSSPTGQPSCSPTANAALTPVIASLQQNAIAMIYRCYPAHLHSSTNTFTSIFGGLSITHISNIQEAVFTMSPYNSEFDEISILKSETDNPDSLKWANRNVTIDGNDGILRVARVGNETVPLNFDLLLNRVAYNLNVNTALANSCAKFTNNQHPATFSVYIADIYGRRSNTIEKALKIKTGK
jgi:hypothetical protein